MFFYLLHIPLIHVAALATASDTDPEVPVSDDDLCLIVFTSGTTGAPKGATLVPRTFLGRTIEPIEGRVPMTQS